MKLLTILSKDPVVRRDNLEVTFTINAKGFLAGIVAYIVHLNARSKNEFSAFLNMLHRFNSNDARLFPPM